MRKRSRPQNDETVYLERFSTTLQAPDFDFRNFPFDKQKFFIRIDLLTPEWLFLLREIKGYSEVGEKLGEEEWVVTDFAISNDLPRLGYLTLLDTMLISAFLVTAIVLILSVLDGIRTTSRSGVRSDFDSAGLKQAEAASPGYQRKSTVR